MEQIKLTIEQRIKLNSSPCFHCEGTNLAVVKENLTTDATKFFYYVACLTTECIIVGKESNTSQEAVDLWCKENDHYLKIRKELDNEV